MPRRTGRGPRVLALVATISLLAMLGGVIAPQTASAAGTVLFQNAFNNRTVDGTGTVTVPSPTSGTNVACLTATGNSATLPLLSCAGTGDAQGSGKLRLTNSTANQVGGVFGQTSFPTSNGLDVTFTSYQWGGGSADGIAFLLGAVDPANPAAPTSIGPSGGSLGYSPAGSVKGLSNAYLGVGLDVFGNFSSNSFSGSGCSNPPNITVPAPGSVVVRGPGNGLVGYCGLTTTYDGTAASKVALRATTRAASAVPVQVLINPTVAAFTSSSGVSVAAGTYKVVFTPVGQATRTLSGTLPSVAAGLYPAASWLNSNGVPKQLAFGFVGSTGSVTDVHEISNTKVLTFNPVPQLAVSTTSYAAATSVPGDPVTYRINASVLAGADEPSPVSVTQTVPVGVVPVGAYGTGWVCQPPVGRTISCTKSGSSVPNGTALPVLTVVAIVTGASVSTSVIQSSSPTGVTSADANPGADTVTTAGTVPAAPTGVAASPAIGVITGGGMVSVTASTNNLPPTAIEIGTVAEQQAGTPVTLLPCSSGRAAGCFNIEGNTLVILSMPARATAATVGITVVTNGVATATSYVYVDRPAAPAAPTATAGITSATVTWVAPAANGSPITGYLVSPYRNGVLQTAISYDASTTTRTLTGLTAGASYTFTVAAVNAYGTSTASTASVAVVPYTLPAAPVITATTAGSLSAVLTWTAPNNGGSAITGYVVKPYIGTTAQPPQTFTGTGTTRTVTGLTAGTTYTFTVAAQNLAGTGPSSAPSPPVTPNQSPSLTFPAPPSGEVGVAYNQPLTVTNGTAPFTWSVSSGTLPGGLTLNATTGLLSGTPTAADSFPFTVQVVDASGEVATKTVTLVIAALPTMTFTPAAGEVGVAYSRQPTLTGGTGPFAWTLTAGSLPAGISLNSTTGLVSGTPTASGSFPVAITATDAFGKGANKTVTLVIVARPAFTDTAPAPGQVGVVYSHTFLVAGGTAPLIWSVPAGSVPAGLSFDTATGVLSGTPTTVGDSSFTVSVVDANSQTAGKPVTLTITPGPLVIVKTANVSSAAPASVVAYTITITNTGTSPFTGVAVSDPLSAVLDDATYGANATATTGTVSYTAPTLGWTGNVGAGASVTITYSVTVNSPVTGNKVLANTVTSATMGTNCASGSVDTRCAATVTVPGLTIVKTADTTTTTPGSTVYFSIVVTNTGQTSYPAATLTDGLAGVLDDATYNADGAATSGNVSYTSPSLTWTGSLAPGTSATITYSVTVADPDTGNRSLTGTVVSPSAGSPCPSSNPAAQCTATVTVLVPALSIMNTADTSSTTPGGVVTYTVTLSNTGQTAYTGTSATVALSAATDDATYDAAAASAGTVTFNPGPATLVWTGNLAVGAVVVITVSVTVRSPDPGDKTLTTVATSAAPGSTCPTGGSSPACTSTVQVRLPALTITTAADVNTTSPGSVVRYTVSVTNTGQTPYTGATFGATLAGVLDDATYNSDAATTSGAVSFSGGTITWTGNLAVGASATVTYSVRIDDPDNGNKILKTTVESATPGNNCPSGGTDPRCASTVSVLIPGLSIATTTDVSTATPGTVVHYSITVANTGETTYTAVEVAYDLSGALDDADYNFDASISSGSLVTRPDGTVVWVGTLAPGDSAIGTMSFTVRAPPTGDGQLVGIATADVPGSTCQTGSADPACRSVISVVIPGLTIAKSANTTTTTPGGVVEYTITVHNDGQTSFPAANFADDLVHTLTDAVYAGGATASTGALSYSDSVLRWSGALAPGESATIGYEVTVRDPDPGDKTITNTVESTTPGNNCPAGGTDPGCTAVVRVLVPGLTVVKTADSPTTAPGAAVHYTVTVTNSGATAYPAATFADSLTGVLDDATYNADATTSAGTVGYAAPTLTWTGALAVSATATVTYSVTVHAADGGDNLVTNVVTSATPGSNCAAGSPDTRCAVAVPVARLVLAYGPTNPTTTPGAVVTFSATYTNTGRVPYVGISVDVLAPEATDDGLPGGDQTASSGTLVLNETGITWTGNIAVGGVVTLGATMGVQNPDLGNKIIIATMESTAPGNNCPPGSTDGRCTVRITVLVPGLTIAKTADTTATVPGGTVGYTITIDNTGETPYTGATVTDSLSGILDDATYNADAVTTSGAVTFTSPTLSWSGDLAAGATATVTYSITVRSPATGDKTMINPVSSTTVGSTCPPASGNPACRSTVVVLTPALTIDKTSDLANATLGTTVTFTVRVRNSGQTSQPAAEFTDPLTGVLDDATYNPADTTATSGTVTYADEVLTWAGTLAPGGSATITYTATINTPASGDRAMANTVTSSTAGANCAEGSTDTRCTATVTVTNAVSLTFTKTADVVAAVRGGQVTYTVTVVNSSGSPVAAEYTDPLAGILDDAAYNADALADNGTIEYLAPNLTWSGTVPALGTATVTYSVTVLTATDGDQILDGTVSSTSLPGSNNCVSGSTDPRCTNKIPVAGLAIEQHFAETTTTPGSVVHLSATFTNTGQLPYQGITVSSPSAGALDDANPNGDQTASSGALVLSATAITWTGDIPVGGVVTVTGTLTVQNPATGDRRITGTLVSNVLGNNCPAGGTDPVCTSLVTVQLPGLTIAKSADTTFVVPGGTAAYTISVHNTGETSYLGTTVTDTLAGVLDDGTYNGDAAATAGNVSFTGSILTWTGDLAVGATVTVTYSVTAHSPATGDKTMVNAASSSALGSTCPPASGNTACRSTIAVLTPALIISSAAGVATSLPGGTVTYTLTATNTGQLPYAEAVVDVPLGDVLDDATYGGGAAATSGAVEVTGTTLTWTGALNPGSAVTITYSVTVADPVTGNYRLTQTVESANQGSTCPTGGADPRCTTSVPVASLGIVNAADVATTKPTSVVRNTVTLTNLGQVPFVGISVSDSFVGSLDDATYNGDAEATAGSLLLVAGTGRIVWSGDLAVGASVVVTGSLTVNNPPLGNKNLSTLVTTSTSATNCPTAAPSSACATSVPVLIPGLTITKAVDALTTAPGSTVGYTITIANTGQTPYTAASVSDSLASVLDDAVYNEDATATSGALGFTAATLTWTGDLTVGQEVVIGYSVQVYDPDLGDKSMVNGVRSSELGSTCPAGSPGPACATFVTVLVPALDIAVTADRTTTVPGGTVGYTVTVTNTGQTPYTGAIVTTQLAGVLDDAGYTGGAVATTGTVTFDAPNLTWSGDLAVNATATITYAVTVADPDAGNRLLATSLTSPAPGSTCGTAAQCVNTVTVLIPGLSVATTADVATTTPGDRVTFTITVANTGQTPYTGTAVSTALTDILDDATYDGEITASSGVGTYTAPNLSWTGTLPVDATATISYSVTVRNPDPGDKALATTVIAPAPGSSCPADAENPGCTATVTVLVPDLTIDKSANVPTTTPGAVVDYTIVVNNSGQTPYVGAVVTDSLSGVLQNADYNADAAVTGGGTLAHADATLTWTGDLPVGASAVITYSITVHDPDTGDKQIVNTATSPAPGNTCPPGNTRPGCSTLVQVLVPATTLTKTANTATVVAGDDVQYTVTLRNTGETDYIPATFTDPLNDVLDDADYAGDALASTGSVEYANDTLVWTGPLDIGDTATVTYTVTARYPATGDGTLSNTATSAAAGGNCATGTDPLCSASVTLLVPALDIAKTTDVTEVVAGATLHYTVSATNTGQADYLAATLTDSLDGVLDDATYNGDAAATTGDVSYSDGTLSWTGVLPVGAAVLITYSVTTQVTGTGDEILANRVISTSVGSSCPETTAGPRCATSTAVAARSITLTGLTPSFTLTGLANSTVSSDGTVTMTVTTNSSGGYAVTVQATTTSLTGAAPGNPTTIPIGQLGVRESGTEPFRPLSADSQLIVHQQNSPSAPSGDAVSNDYQIRIPFVPSDTYSTTLEYIASAQ